LKLNLHFATFERRLSRVSALVRFQGKEEIVHLNNTGKLLDLLIPGTEVALIPIRGRKTRFRIAGTRVNNEWFTLIDTNLQEKSVVQWIEEERIKWLRGYRVVGRHVKTGDSRMDLLLSGPDGKPFYLEIKSAVFYFPEDGSARYPDTITERGQKHIRHLMEMEGKRGILFIAAHPLAEKFRPCKNDPQIPRLLKMAKEKGVILKGIKMALHRSGEVVLLNDDLPVEV